MGTGEWIVIGFSAVLAAWFLIGSYLNSQHSQRILAWLVDGAPTLGKVIGARFLANTSAGFRAMIKFENGPVAQIEVVMTLLRRENLPLWLFQVLTRKPDLLTLNFTLRHAPLPELWAFQSQKASTLAEQANRAQKSPLVFQQETATHRLYTRGKTDEALFENFKRFLDANPTVKILATQPQSPHLILAIPLSIPPRLSASNLLQQIHQILF